MIENAHPGSQDNTDEPGAASPPAMGLGSGRTEPPPPPPPPPLPPATHSRRTGRGCLVGCAIVAILFAALIITGVVAGLGEGLEGTTSFLSMTAGEPEKFDETIVESGDFDRKIVIISVRGIIHSGESHGGESVPSGLMVKQIKAAMNDTSVKAVLLDMNTPGGEVTATDEIHHALQQLRESGKIVVTCMRTVAASGGYYLAAGTDYIVANRLSLTGSIGVVIGGYNLAELLDKIGVESEMYTSGKMKDLLNMARPRTDEERQLIQNMVDEIYLEFAKIVAAGRPQVELDDLMPGGPLSDARIFSGSQALANGLVDELGFLEDAIAKTKKLASADGAAVVRYKLRPTLSELLFSMRSPRADPLAALVPPERQLIKKGQLYFLYPLAY